MKLLVSYPIAATAPGHLPTRPARIDIGSTHTKSYSRIATKPNKDRSSFITALVHELRNPLTNINLSVELLESASTDDKWKPFLDIIRRSSARINALINDLLTAKRDEEAVQKHSIHQLLDEALELARDRIRLKNVVVIKTYAPDYELSLNVLQIKIALINIIVNAIDAMVAGEGRLTIITKLIEGRYVVMIKDNGYGISKENLEKIFEPHYTNKPGGLGIGLAATANILRSNNITVNVESRETEGTCFTLLFDRNE